MSKSDKLKYFDVESNIDAIYQAYQGSYHTRVIKYIVMKDKKINVMEYAQNIWNKSPNKLINDAVTHFTSMNYNLIGILSSKYPIEYWTYELIKSDPSIKLED